MEVVAAKADTEDKYYKANSERTKHVQKILASASPKKVVVAGPGTGKTFLFKELLKGKTNTITLTFINSLVEDLSLELYGISNVLTLHSFGRSQLGAILKKKIKIHPKLSKVIRQDSEILQGTDVDFNKIFHERDDTNSHIAFYETRRQYYDYYGYADVIFTTVKYYESDPATIPTFEQILVDEFQDFNKLEVSLIELLASKSPILLAGDDDQALYDFKHASAEYIREKHSEKMPEYESFSLPYCARCPRVVVDATNDLISSAQKNGLLKGRIDKPFIYFDHKDKDKVSDHYPKIIHTKTYANAIAWKINKCIDEMALDIKDKFSVLIISPYKQQSKQLVKALREKGLANIDYKSKEDENELTLLEGFNLLLLDKTDNLGWRIVTPFFISPEDFATIIKSSAADPSKKIFDLLAKDVVKIIKDIIKSLKFISGGKPISPELLASTLKLFKIDPNSLATELLQEKINSFERSAGNPAIRKIPIKATTIQSSKGLAADIVFITHFDDQYFIKGFKQKVISDQDICNFLVALTRAKKKVFLISSADDNPTFLTWIAGNNIQKIK